MDDVAERVCQLGHYAEGQLKDYIRLTRLGGDGYSTDQKTQLKSLLEGLESIMRNLRNNINEFNDNYKDAGTADVVTGKMEKLEKIAW
jgi:starvation-inducible DNA-binding protein